MWTNSKPRALENLETYVRDGGGLAVFLGPNANLRFYNRWYAEGQGLFPVPIAAVADLAEGTGEETADPDLQFVDHPVFRVLTGQRNPFAEQHPRPAIVSRTPTRGSHRRTRPFTSWRRLRNQQPIVIERQFGDGRVMAFLTTLTPTWNNWALEPSLIVVALQLHAYLASPQHATHERSVGSPITLQLDPSQYRPNRQFSRAIDRSGRPQPDRTEPRSRAKLAPPC